MFWASWLVTPSQVQHLSEEAKLLNSDTQRFSVHTLFALNPELQQRETQVEKRDKGESVETCLLLHSPIISHHTDECLCYRRRPKALHEA